MRIRIAITWQNHLHSLWAWGRVLGNQQFVRLPHRFQMHQTFSLSPQTWLTKEAITFFLFLANFAHPYSPYSKPLFTFFYYFSSHPQIYLYSRYNTSTSLCADSRKRLFNFNSFITKHYELLPSIVQSSRLIKCPPAYTRRRRLVSSWLENSSWIRDRQCACICLCADGAMSGELKGLRWWFIASECLRPNSANEKYKFN